MTVYLAEVGNKYMVERMKEENIGRMFSRGWYKLYPGEQWGFDNGAYSAWRKGEEFPTKRFLRRLNWGLNNRPPPSLAVCPDIVMGGMESLEFSTWWRPRLPDHWPWYLAVQDGMTPDDIKGCLNDFSGIFVGGSTAFKSTIPQWQELGKPVHFGACGTTRKLRWAVECGVDSLDSSTPVQNGANHFEMFLSTYRHGDPQRWLFAE